MINDDSLKVYLNKVGRDRERSNSFDTFIVFIKY